LNKTKNLTLLGKRQEVVWQELGKRQEGKRDALDKKSSIRYFYKYGMLPLSIIQKTIEVASSSLADDKGEKRLFYEDIEVGEYWIVDVKKAELIAFTIANGGSLRITESQVLPGLSMSLLEEALQRIRESDRGQVFSWLLAQFQQ